MLRAEISSLRPISVEDARMVDVARSPYVLVSVSLLLGSAIYLLALIAG
jgi:hypothetical protein